VSLTAIWWKRTDGSRRPALLRLGSRDMNFNSHESRDLRGISGGHLGMSDRPVLIESQINRIGRESR